METKRGSRSQVKPRWNSSIRAEASSSLSASSPSTVPSPALAGSSIARSRPAEKVSPSPVTTTTRTSSGSERAELAERQPHGRGLRVAHLGTVQGDRGDGAVHVEAEADRGELFGSHAEQVTTRE